MELIPGENHCCFTSLHTKQGQEPLPCITINYIQSIILPVCQTNAWDCVHKLTSMVRSYKQLCPAFSSLINPNIG